jgi:hypothetical protein
MELQPVVFDFKEESLDVLVRKFIKIGELAKAYEEARKELSKALLERMGEQETLVGTGYLVKRVDCERETVDVKSLVIAAEIAPSLVARYTKKTKYSYPKLEVAP